MGLLSGCIYSDSAVGKGLLSVVASVYTNWNATLIQADEKRFVLDGTEMPGDGFGP